MTRCEILRESGVCVWSTANPRLHYFRHKNTGTVPSSIFPTVASQPGLVSLHLQRQGELPGCHRAPPEFTLIISVLGLRRQGMLLHLELLRWVPAPAGGPQQTEAQREAGRHHHRHHHPPLPHHQRHPRGRHPRAAGDIRAVQLHPFILW